jgi:hypothetical protein
VAGDPAAGDDEEKSSAAWLRVDVATSLLWLVNPLPTVNVGVLAALVANWNAENARQPACGTFPDVATDSELPVV